MDKLLIGFTTLRPGQFPRSRDVSLTIAPGEGRARLDPDEPPTLGTITQGRLVLESESFPRFAPLTLTLTGADLVFRVRDRRLVQLTFQDGREPLLRLYCTGIFRAAFLHRLFQPLDDRLVVTRTNTLSEDCDDQTASGYLSRDVHCRTVLAVHLLEGALVTSPDYSKGLQHVVEWGAVELRRSGSGILKLQLHGARLVCDIARGNLAGLRVYDSRGPVANLSFLDASGAGVSASVAVVDTLP